MAIPKRTRALPRQRKIFGTSHDIDGEVMVYTEKQVAAFGDDCFADGLRAGAALRELSGPTATIEPDPRQAEEDAWSDYRAGRGPRPAGRR